jgi:hypothetical protein
MRPIVPFLALLLATGVAFAEGVPDADDDATAAATTDAAARTEAAADETEAPAEQKESGPKRISGMSVLGNQEAPKSLVIVPWKSSEIGDSLGISAMLDEGRQPVDRDVFLRSLTYYEIRSEGTPSSDVPVRPAR